MAASKPPPSSRAKAVAQDESASNRVRYSVSLVRQGKHQFYTLTMFSDVLAETCVVTTRKEDPKAGFQRELDEKRAIEIAEYIDNNFGTIPTSIILSAQKNAELKIVGRGKTLEFSKVPGAFLILDGQHRVYGFSKAKTPLRVPVVIYNNLSREEETRLFIDINTKQKPVPAQLLLDIKQLASIESEAEETLRSIFDLFADSGDSALRGLMSPYDSVKGKVSRVTFNHAVKPLLPSFPGRSEDEIYRILNAYLSALSIELIKRSSEPLLTKPVVFRAFLAMFKPVAQRVVDKTGGDFSASNFQELLSPLLANMPIKKLTNPGTSWTSLREYLEDRFSSKIVF